MNNDKLFNELLKADGIDPQGPSETERKNFAKLLDQQSKTNPTLGLAKQNIWRVIMNSKITKYAAAAMVMIALGLSLTIMEKSTPMAMADIMEAMHSVRYLHLKVFEEDSETTQEAWIEFDNIGHVRNVRMHINSATGPEDESVKVVTWTEGKARIWIEKKNVLVTIFDQQGAENILEIVTKLDPKNTIEKLLEGEEKGDLVLDIQEPSNKIDPIVIEAEVPAENKLLVLSIDQATKLLTSFEIHLLEDGEYKYKSTIEYHDYNQPIDPAMFVLEDEIPEDAMIIDQTTGQVGLKQGQLSDHEIATEVVRQFFEAMIAKDYAKAGVLYSGFPADRLEQTLGQMQFIEIVSIGAPTKGMIKNSLKVPCVVNILEDGQVTEWSPYGPFIRKMDDRSDRWVIIGGI